MREYFKEGDLISVFQKIKDLKYYKKKQFDSRGLQMIYFLNVNYNLGE